ncbi:MAG TPA: hypothetical protein VFV17_04985 [Usitatibacteraceae bacterium]|nr:hypothetical protein [Usitatibacteraceae bacterium]
MNAPQSPARAPRSAFVGSLAWSFIVLGGFGALIALAQLVAAFTMYSAEELRLLANDLRSLNLAPPFMAWIIEHLRLWIGCMLALSLVTVWAAVGLLARREWARIVFAAMMFIGVLWNLVGAAAPFFMQSMLAAMLESVPPDSRGDIAAMAGWMAWASAAIAAVFALVFAWCGVRLLQADIRAEFRGGAS